jgi:hypothetical protein
MMPGDPMEYDRNDFLRELIFNDRLYGTALEITRRVIEWGEGALSEKERYVFQRNVIEVFVTDECSRLGCRIPWSEMYQAHDNGGRCGDCRHMDAKIMNRSLADG